MNGMKHSVWVGLAPEDSTQLHRNHYSSWADRGMVFASSTEGTQDLQAAPAGMLSWQSQGEPIFKGVQEYLTITIHK